MFCAQASKGSKKIRYLLFVKAEQKLEKIIKYIPFEQQREHFGGQSRAFSWKKPMFLFFLHNRKRFSTMFSEAKSVPKVIFGAPKGTYSIGFSNLSLPSAENREEHRILRWNYGLCGSQNTFFPFLTFKVGLMVRLKSHLWPPCTLCRLQESFKKLVKYVRGRGGEAPGGAPDGRCPKCRTVAHRLHFGAHFGRWFLLTFVNSSAKTKKMRSPKGVKSENHVKYGTFAKDGFSPKTRFSRKPRRASKYS